MTRRAPLLALLALSPPSSSCVLLGVEAVPCAAAGDCPSSLAFCVDGTCAGAPAAGEGDVEPFAFGGFERNVDNGWGDADRGGLWQCNGDTDITVAGGAGLVTPSDECQLDLLRADVDLGVSVCPAATPTPASSCAARRSAAPPTTATK